MPPSPYEAAKNLAQNLELDYFRRPRTLTHALRLATWGTVLVSVGAVGYMLLPGQQWLLQAGPLSTAHAMFNDNCAHCHQEAFRTASRLWLGDRVSSVPDSACQACHPGPNHQEARDSRPAVTAEGCMKCHKEHRGRSLLARVADGHCADCHARPDKVGPKRTLTDFAHHPEFALRDDEGTIRFNHQAHLNLPSELRAIGGPLKQLREQSCAFCHQPEAAGRSMQPVRYQQHCRQCHPLSIQVATGPFPRVAGESEWAFARQPVLHPGASQTAAVVRGDIRNRFTRFARENSGCVPPWLPVASLVGRLAAADSGFWILDFGFQISNPKSKIENRKPKIKNPDDSAQLGWLDFQVRQAERALFNGPDGCRRCHTETTVPFQRPHGLPEYHQPHMNDRWYTSSRFNHKSHRMLDCLQCHKQAATSTVSTDVLLPKIDNCRQCHKPAAGARSDCVECHVFHHAHEPPRPGVLTIDDALGTGKQPK